MNDKKLANRIPFEDIESMKSWQMPSVSGKLINKKKEIQKKGKESIEEVRPEDLQAVTAEQLQKVAEEAENEGREKGYQEGIQQGFSEGEKQGLKNGEAKAYNDTKAILESKIETFQSMVNALLDPVDMQDAALENTIVDMVVNFTRHLINRELSQDPSGLFKIVEQVVGGLPTGANNIKIHLHPDDVELANEAFESSGKDWTFYADESLSRGGCRVETAQSLIDYSIEHRIKTMLERVDFQGDVDELDYQAPDYRPIDSVKNGAQFEEEHSDDEFVEEDFIEEDVNSSGVKKNASQRNDEPESEFRENPNQELNQVPKENDDDNVS